MTRCLTNPPGQTNRYIKLNWQFITIYDEVSHRSTWAILPWSSVLFSWFVFTTHLANNHNQMVIVIVIIVTAVFSIIVITFLSIESGTKSKLNSTVSWILPKTQEYIENRSNSNICSTISFLSDFFFGCKRFPYLGPQSPPQSGLWIPHDQLLVSLVLSSLS